MKWKNIEGGMLAKKGRQNDDNWGTEKINDAMMEKHLDTAFSIIDKVPSEMLIIMKSNDLIRCLETKLTKGTSSENYVDMAYLCLIGMRRIEMLNAVNKFDTTSVRWKYLKPLASVF